MRSKDSMLTSKVNLKKRKLFGKENLNSLKDKRIKPRRTTKMPSSNSNKLLINFRKSIWMERPSMNIIRVLLCNNLKINSRKRSKNQWNRSFQNKCNSKLKSRGLRRTTRILTKDLNYKEAAKTLQTRILRKSSKE